MPASAPSHLRRTTCGRRVHNPLSGISHRILAKLPDIAVHVVEAPCIGKLAPDDMGCTDGIEPGIDGKPTVIGIVAVAEASHGASAACVLPLRLSGHSINPTRRDPARGLLGLGKPYAVERRILPAYHFHRQPGVAHKH